MRSKLRTLIMGILVFPAAVGFASSLSSCDFVLGGPVQTGERNIVSISTEDPDTTKVVYIGEFDQAGIKLLVVYSDGNSETVPVTESMIPEAYKHYLENPGKVNITILFRGTAVTLKLDVQYRYFLVDFYALVNTSTPEKIATQSVKKGEAAVAPTNYLTSVAYDHTIYTWTGWDVDFSNITSDLTVKATYSEESVHWVSFFNGANTLIKKDYVKDGANAVAPTEEEIAMSGYEFLGWDRAFANITHDIEVYGIYFKITAIANPVASGEYSLGKFPQTVVSDSTLLSSLATAVDSDSDGYLEYGDNEYAKVVASPFTSAYSSTPATPAFVSGSTYYFKVEPIIWKVLSRDGSNKGLLLSKYVLGKSSFFLSTADRTIDGSTVHANNYVYSNLRAMLNGYDGSSYGAGNFTGTGFYDKAFSQAEKSKVATTVVDNTALLDSPVNSEGHPSANTNDKVFVLSTTEVSNATYGLTTNELRRATMTDYAKATGVAGYTSSQYANNGEWWLRNAMTADPTWIKSVDDDGVMGYVSDYDENKNAIGFRPSVTASLI